MSPSTHILVIDDDPDVRDALADLLEIGGYDALTAADGLAGMELYRQHRDEIGLVMLDLRMPGMRGEETLAGLRKIDPDSRILIMSGYDENEVFRQVSRESGHLGRTSYVQKPFDIDELLNLLAKLTR